MFSSHSSLPLNLFYIVSKGLPYSIEICPIVAALPCLHLLSLSERLTITTGSMISMILIKHMIEELAIGPRGVPRYLPMTVTATGSLVMDK